MKKGVENLKHQENCRIPDALVRSEPKKVDNQNNSSLETNAIIRSPESREPENIFKSRTLKLIDKSYDSVTSDKQYHNGKKLQKCFVKIQKLPNTYNKLAKNFILFTSMEKCFQGQKTHFSDGYKYGASLHP